MEQRRTPQSTDRPIHRRRRIPRGLPAAQIAPTAGTITLPDDQGFFLVETANDASVTAGTRTILLRASSQTATYVLQTVN